MKVNDGIHWIIHCTREFDRTVAFFRDIMGLRLAEEGIPVTDTQFTRYALLRLPVGGTLEIVEPADEAVGALYATPVITFKVDDLAQARRDLSGDGRSSWRRSFRRRSTWPGPTFEHRTDTCTRSAVTL